MNTKIGLLKIDHKEAVLYQFEPSTNEGKRQVDNWLLSKRIKTNSKRHSSIDEHHYFEEVAKKIEPFGILIMAAHGKGHANEGDRFQTHIYKHHKQMRNLVVGHIATHNHRTENQLLAEADALLEKLELKLNAIK